MEESCDVPMTEEEAAKAALLASPLVKDIGDLRGARPGVYARLWCSCEHPRRDSEQLCFSATRKDRAACATELLELVTRKHADHIAAAEAARAAAAAEASAAAGPSAPTTAFAAMAAAQQVQPAAERAAAAEKLAAEARGSQRAAEARLADANKAVEMAEAEARRLEEEVCCDCGLNPREIVLGRPCPF